MGSRKIVIRQSVTESIAEVSWYLESEGLPATAEKFADNIYDFIEKLGDNRKKYRTCREPQRILMGCSQPKPRLAYHHKKMRH